MRIPKSETTFPFVLSFLCYKKHIIQIVTYICIAPMFFCVVFFMGLGVFKTMFMKRLLICFLVALLVCPVFSQNTLTIHQKMVSNSVSGLKIKACTSSTQKT